MSAKKVKNNLLAAVLVLTVIPLTVKVSQNVIERCCFLISQQLLEMDEVRCLTIDFSFIDDELVIIDILTCRPMRQDTGCCVYFGECPAASVFQVIDAWLDRVCCKDCFAGS
jgi:hypothetical protein